MSVEINFRFEVKKIQTRNYYVLSPLTGPSNGLVYIQSQSRITKRNQSGNRYQILIILSSNKLKF